MAYDPSGGLPTMSMLLHQMDPSGKLGKIGDILSQTNDALTDMPFFEANEITSHRIIVDATLPTPTWRRLNTGITPSEGTTAQVSEAIGMLEARSEADVVLARMSKDVSQFRLTQARRKLEGISQELASTLWYGDIRTYPDRFFGIAPRYAALGNPSAALTANTLGMSHVLSAGGSTSVVQSSIYLVGWGEGKVYGIYPSGSTAGVEQQDLGEIDCRDADGKVFRGLAAHYRVQQGLAVEDWRYIVRIANLEVTAAMTADTINVLVGKMIDAKNALPNLGDCKPCFYMNRAVKSMFEKAAHQKGNVFLNVQDVYDLKSQLTIAGIPMRQSDAILLTEAVVS